MPLDRPGERAVILSLAAEDAIRREDWDDLATLLRQRALEIHRLVEKQVAINAADHQFLLTWQERVLQQLVNDKQAVVREVANLQREKRARLAYAGADPFRSSSSAA